MKPTSLLYLLVNGMFAYCAVTLAAAPKLNKILPSKVDGTPCAQNFTLTGSGFNNDMKVLVTYTDEKIRETKILDPSDVTTNSAIIRINTLGEPDTWTIQVRNSDSGSLSNIVEFVVAPDLGDLGAVIGKFSGVEAMSNGKCTGTLKGTCRTNYACEAPYQCVDLVKRFYKTNYPEITEVISIWKDAQTFWNREKHTKLYKYTNIENGIYRAHLPKSGDMIFFDTGLKEGHVAIVTHVSKKEIGLIQQNIDRYNANAILKLTNEEATGLVRIGQLNNKYGVLGWLSQIPTISGSCTRLNAVLPSTSRKPACPYAYESSYLYECTVLPMSGNAKREIKAYGSQNSISEFNIIKPNVAFSAVARKRIMAPCPLKVKEVRSYFPKGTFKPGDIIFLISQIGEGSSKYWFDGAIVQSNDSICTPSRYRSLDCWAEPLMSCPRDGFNKLINAEEWLQVKTNDGVEGWVNISTTGGDAIKWEEGCQHIFD